MNMNPAKYEYQSEFAKRYLAQGLAEGRAELLSRQLARRFGDLSEPVIKRLRTSSIAELDAIGDRILTASTLEEALGER